MLNPNDTVWIAAPNMNQAEKLSSSLQSIKKKAPNAIFNKRKLFERFIKSDVIQKLEESVKNPNIENSLVKLVTVDGGKVKKYQITPEESWLLDDIDEKTLPQVIFIDEVTHFNKAELTTLEFLAKKYNIKLITSGDTLQRGGKVGSILHNIETMYSWKPPRLLISVRANNIENKDNTDQAKQRLIVMEDLLNTQGLTDETKVQLDDIIRSSIFEVKYFESDSELHGTKIVDSLTEPDLRRLLAAVQHANSNLKEGEPKKKIGILADLKKNADGDWEIADSKFKRQLEDLGLNEGQYTLYYSPDDFNERAVQGSEEEYFIIKDINVDPLSDDRQDQLISFYTYITRSMAGGLLAMPDSLVRTLNIVNRKMPNTDSYAMPGLDKQVELKTTRIADIDKIIGANYAINEEPLRTPVNPDKADAADAADKTNTESNVDDPKPIDTARESKALAADETKKVSVEVNKGEDNLMAEKSNTEEPAKQDIIGSD